ncbi:hypothetical protein [Desulfocastanea catecholica]
MGSGFEDIKFDEAVENSREADENVLQDVCDAFAEGEIQLYSPRVGAYA